ncbi:MAG: hypothetical protein GX977_13590, partial [Firmicutes bacterium]|nr:hypothetical protein [Bacillota bacterium]
MGKRKWALLAVLLGMMVVMSGCFGGGSRVETGGVTGYVLAPTEDVDLLEATKGQSAIAKLVIKPGVPPEEPIYEDYTGLPGAKVRAVGTRCVATTGFNGHFVLDSIPVGNQIIEITHEAYKGKLTIPVEIEANRNKPIAQQKMQGKGYYLLIGVGNHQVSNIWSYYGYDQPLPIPAVSNDLRIMKEVFSADNALLGAPPVVLEDNDASMLGVTSALEELIGQMKRGDYLVIYFSGHGIGGTARDDRGNEIHAFDAIALYDDFVSDGELRDIIIESIFAEQGLNLSDITLLIDSCYSGSFADGNVRKKQPKAFQKRGYTVIAASQPEEKSWTRDNDSSLFSYYLERG